MGLSYFLINVDLCICKTVENILNAGGDGIVVMSSFIVLGTWNIKQNLNPLVSIAFRSSIL